MSEKPKQPRPSGLKAGSETVGATFAGAAKRKLRKRTDKTKVGESGNSAASDGRKPT